MQPHPPAVPPHPAQPLLPENAWKNSGVRGQAPPQGRAFIPRAQNGEGAGPRFVSGDERRGASPAPSPARGGSGAARGPPGSPGRISAGLEAPGTSTPPTRSHGRGAAQPPEQFWGYSRPLHPSPPSIPAPHGGIRFCFESSRHPTPRASAVLRGGGTSHRCPSWRPPEQQNGTPGPPWGERRQPQTTPHPDVPPQHSGSQSPPNDPPQPEANRSRPQGLRGESGYSSKQGKPSEPGGTAGFHYRLLLPGRGFPGGLRGQQQPVG